MEATASVIWDTTSGQFNISGVFERYRLVEFLLVHCPKAVFIDRSITPLWYIFGLVGNTLSAIIWLQRRMYQNNSSAIYLAAISIWHLIFLLLHMVQELQHVWSVRTMAYPVFCEAHSIFYMTSQYLSPILVLCFTVERYIAVCHPFRKERFCTTSRALKVVVGAMVSCAILSAIQGYFWTYDPVETVCDYRKSVLEGGNQSLWTVWSWTTEMTVFLVVPVIILFFNILVILEVRNVSKLGQTNPTMHAGASRKGGGGESTSTATTVMILSVSFYVIVMTLPATLVYTLLLEFREGDHYMTDEQIRTDPTWNRYFTYILVRKIIEEICLSHYACNFILYVITGAHFRRALRELFGCRPLSRGGNYSEIGFTTQKTDVSPRTTHL